jgi:hypothetical protein
MIFVPAGSVLVAFLAVIAGWGPEFFGGWGLVAAIAAFRCRHRNWWCLSAAVAALTAGTGILVRWATRPVLTAAVVVFAVVAIIRAAGHVRSVR